MINYILQSLTQKKSKFALGKSKLSQSARGLSIYYVHPQGGWVGCRGVYPDVLWWVGGFSLDVCTNCV